MRRNKIKAMLCGAAVGVSAAGLVSGCANPQKDGTAALREGNYEEAEAQFQKAAKEEDRGRSAEGYRGLGMTYYETQEYDKALESFEQALDLGAEQSVQLYHQMSVCAMNTGDYEKGLEYVQAGLALSAGSGDEAADEAMLREMKYNEIVCYEQQADWENARQKVGEYLSEYPDDEAVQKEAEFLKTR